MSYRAPHKVLSKTLSAMLVFPDRRHALLAGLSATTRFPLPSDAAASGADGRRRRTSAAVTLAAGTSESETGRQTGSTTASVTVTGTAIERGTVSAEVTASVTGTETGTKIRTVAATLQTTTGGQGWPPNLRTMCFVRSYLRLGI